MVSSTPAQRPREKLFSSVIAVFVCDIKLMCCDAGVFCNKEASQAVESMNAANNSLRLLPAAPLLIEIASMTEQRWSKNAMAANTCPTALTTKYISHLKKVRPRSCLHTLLLSSAWPLYRNTMVLMTLRAVLQDLKQALTAFPMVKFLDGPRKLKAIVSKTASLHGQFTVDLVAGKCSGGDWQCRKTFCFHGEQITKRYCCHLRCIVF